eukprot:gene28097-31205_t
MEIVFKQDSKEYLKKVGGAEALAEVVVSVAHYTGNSRETVYLPPLGGDGTLHKYTLSAPLPSPPREQQRTFLTMLLFSFTATGCTSTPYLPRCPLPLANNSAPPYNAPLLFHCHRLHKYTLSAPLPSPEREQRRTATARFCAAMIAGRRPSAAEGGAHQQGASVGCTTTAPFKSALSLFESGTSGEGQESGTDTETPSNASNTLKAVDTVAAKLVHSFPWDANARVQLALLRRSNASNASNALKAVDTVAAKLVHSSPWDANA